MLHLLAGLAIAGPFDLQHSGRALATDGSPLEGPHGLALTVYTTAGGEAWTHDYGSVTFTQGYYSVTLAGLDTEWLSSDLELEVTVDGTPLLPRSDLIAVPRAQVASAAPLGDATDVAAGCGSRGQLLYDTDRDALLACNGSEWFIVGANYATIIEAGTGKAWTDGTFARTCQGYRSPTGRYAYEGQIGDGVYRIDPEGDGSAIRVFCDMSWDGGGWTLVLHSTYTGSDMTSGLVVNQATRRSTTVGTIDSYSTIATSGYYFLAMDPFKAVADQSTALRFESDNYRSHSLLQNFSMNSTFSLDGSNEETIRSELCGGQANCFVDAQGLSTTDHNGDNSSQFCLPSYGSVTWWYDTCYTYNPWRNERGHFSGYSSKDPNSNHWSWWLR